MVRVATLLTLALASFCAASPVLVKRNVTLIGLDIDAVAAQVTVVDNALKAFNGTIQQAFNSAIASNKLVVLLKKTTKDVVAGGKIPFFDTLPILTKLLLFEGTILSSIHQLITKKDLFVAVGTQKVAKTLIGQLTNATDDLGAALLNATNPIYHLPEKAYIATLDIAFAIAAKAYEEF